MAEGAVVSKKRPLPNWGADHKMQREQDIVSSLSLIMKRATLVSKKEYIDELARVQLRQDVKGVAFVSPWTFQQIFNEILNNGNSRFDLLEHMYHVSPMFREKVREINQPRPADAGPAGAGSAGTGTGAVRPRPHPVRRRARAGDGADHCAPRQLHQHGLSLLNSAD